MPTHNDTLKTEREREELGDSARARFHSCIGGPRGYTQDSLSLGGKKTRYSSRRKGEWRKKKSGSAARAWMKPATTTIIHIFNFVLVRPKSVSSVPWLRNRGARFSAEKPISAYGGRTYGPSRCVSTACASARDPRASAQESERDERKNAGARREKKEPGAHEWNVAAKNLRAARCSLVSPPLLSLSRR